ncbi:MAG: YegS/Rv2252/BmrU family lipid kinase [Clostridia bacterium]|nr:YegS/Rv2252/BmrU family lipid kinase [Clostridia bacterium]
MSAESKKLFFVVNPQSGTLKAGSHLLNMVKELSDAGYSITVYPTKARGDATEQVANLCDCYDTVVACGGDGTLNEVITGMFKGNKKFKIGYIPAGTQNEWSTGLRIPRNLVDAAKVISAGKTAALDIGSFNDSYFEYTASFGALTEASYSAPQQVKNVLGQAAYIFEGLRCLGNIKPINIRAEHDNGFCEGEYLFGAVSNSLSVGGVIKLKENIVNLSDGKFEVALIKKPKTAIEFQSLVSSIITQNFNDPLIDFIHTSYLKVTSEVDIDWTLDGEKVEGGKCAEIKNLHRIIDFYVPDDELSILA